MAIEPTSIQRDKMLSKGKTRLSLAQFLVPKDSGAMKEYFHDTVRAVQDEGGSRDHELVIDQSITSSEFPHRYLVVDSFPSSQALLMAHENTREIRQDALGEVYSILVKPDHLTTRLTKALGFLQSFINHVVDTKHIKELNDLSNQLDPETDPDQDKIAEFGRGNLDKPFLMMNLNQFNPGGKKVYKHYSRRITPYLISVGGYPEIFGSVLGTYLGDEKSLLLNRWHEFGLVYYPTRASFLRMMTNAPNSAAKIRRKGLRKAVLMSCS